MSSSMRKEIQLVESGLDLLKGFVAEGYSFEVDFEPVHDDEVDVWLDEIDPENPETVLKNIEQKYKDQAWAIVSDDGEIMADWEDDGYWQNPGNSEFESITHNDEQIDELSINPFKAPERPAGRFDHIDNIEQLQNMADRLSREGAPSNPSDPMDARRQIHDRIQKLEQGLEQTSEGSGMSMFPELDTKVISFEDIKDEDTGKPTGQKRAIVWKKDVQSGHKFIEDIVEGDPSGIYDWMDEKGYLELEIEDGFLFDTNESTELDDLWGWDEDSNSVDSLAGLSDEHLVRMWYDGANEKIVYQALRERGYILDPENGWIQNSSEPVVHDMKPIISTEPATAQVVSEAETIRSQIPSVSDEFKLWKSQK